MEYTIGLTREKATRPETRQTRDRNILLREEERKGKENSGIGEMDVYLYVPNIKILTRQIHANKYFQVTRRFHPNSVHYQ